VSDELDTWHTPNAICPYCGYENYDSWEIAGGEEFDGEHDCHSCGETMLISRNVEVTYTTKAKP